MIYSRITITEALVVGCFLCGGLACLIRCVRFILSQMRFFLILSSVFLSFSFEVLADTGDALAVQRILERYTETLGGSRAVEALSSLSIEGTQTQNGKSYHFLMRKKRPNSIRYRLNAGDTSIICGFNGRLGWQRTKVGAEVTTRFRIRWASTFADLDPQASVTFDGRSYNVVAVKEIGRREGLELTANARAD